MLFRFPQRLIAAALTLAVCGNAASAQTAVTWTQGVIGNWNVFGNWAGLLAPDQFPNNGANTYTVTIPGVAGQANTTTVIFDNTTIAGNAITVSGLTLSSALNASGNNSAELVLGAGVTLNAGNLTNFSGTTLSGGRYFIDGTLRFNGANVQTLAAGTTLVMNGPAAQVLNQATNVNALSGFKTNDGIFDIRNAYNFSAATGWNNSGIVSVSEGSVFSTVGSFTNTGTLLASGVSGTGTIGLNNTVMANAGGTLSAGNNGVINVSATTVNGGTLTTSGNGRITFSNSGSNNLSGVTLAGTADLAGAGVTSTRVTNGLVFGTGGVFNLNNASVVSFTGDNTLSGTGSIVLGTTGANTVAVDQSNATLTLGAGVTIRGANGVVGVPHFNGTANSALVNNGLISADVNLGTITVASATVSNNNILEGKNGGTLSLASNVNNSASGQLRATDNGVVLLNGSTITGGALNTATGGRITATNNSSNTLNGVTVNGTVHLASALSGLRVVNGITFGGGNFNINQGSGLAFTGNTTTSGNGSITFGAGAGNQVAVDGSNSIFTVGSGTLIHGQNGSVGAQRYLGTANSTVANNGTISADVNGGTITLVQATVANNNVLEAKNGGILDVQTTVNNTANGKLNANNNGVIVVNGQRINGGTINTASGGRFTATYNGSNFINDVTVNGGIDLATTLGAFSVAGATGLTLNAGAVVNIDQGSVVAFRGAQTLSGSGAIVFGSNGGGQVGVDQSNSVFSVAAGATIRGHTGIVGTQFAMGTANSSMINNGRISADVAGGTIDIRQARVVNNGILEAKNGGTLMLSSDVTGNAGSQISAGVGSSVVQNGVVLSGVINSTGTGSVRPTLSSGNFLDGVALTGTLDLASNQASERAVNGLALNGIVNINNGSYFAFQGTQTLSGNGTMVFGATGSNIVGVDQSNSVLTIGPAATIRGANGVIGSQVYLGTANSSIVNNGRISADVSGGTIEMAQATVVNNGIMEALNGGTLKLSSNISGTSTGQFAAGANSVILQNGVSVSGTINSTGSGAFKATNSNANFFNGVTVNGNVDLASSLSSERIINGLTLNGAINLNQNSVLAFQGVQTLSGNGTINLGNSGSNLVGVDQSNAVLTIGSSVLIRGENGIVGAQAYLGTANSSVLNNGRISADVSGGTITLAQATFNNNNILEARNGGTLNITTGVVGSATGQVNAHDNGIALLNNATMTGGSINTSNGGSFRATNSAGNFMNGVTVNGNVDLAHAVSSVRVSGGMTLGSTGVVNVNSGSTLVFNGSNTLNGTGTILFGASAGNIMAIDVSNSTLNIGSGVTVRGTNATIGNQYFVGSASTHLINNGTINSDGGGTISIGAGQLADVVNNGTFRAQNGTFNNGLTVTGTGTLQVDATGVMNMANAGSGNVQNKLIMGAAGATLNTNNRNITINEDYTNVGAGSGNAFNRRAGIVGTGQILAGGDVAQSISGSNVSNGATANATLTIGNVRTGTTTYGYNVVNTGTVGPNLRGAIQTSVNGANISDARLSGAGVTASNYGPTLLGGSFGPLNVNFTVGTAGALAPLNGQAVNLRSNFENIADQKLNIVLGAGAAAYNVAVGSAGTPVNLGNTRVGGTLAGNVTVSNTAAGGNFSEKLDATFGANTGNVSNNGGSISLLAAGSSNNTAMGVSLSSATSGAKTGTATLNYVSNGTGTSNLASIAAGSQ
ncbi:MAG: hypothetical protein H7Z40_23405, partial [Phycisphaerae bacterium]|nr:hypothetical protein [Gemmatimonadaceae bacterium]